MGASIRSLVSSRKGGAVQQSAPSLTDLLKAANGWCMGLGDDRHAKLAVILKMATDRIEALERSVSADSAVEDLFEQSTPSDGGPLTRSDMQFKGAAETDFGIPAAPFGKVNGSNPSHDASQAELECIQGLTRLLQG